VTENNGDRTVLDEDEGFVGGTEMVDVDVENMSLPPTDGSIRRNAFWARLFNRFKSPASSSEPWRD